MADSILPVVEPEPADVEARWVHVAARMLSAGAVLFYAAFLYADVYLRSTDRHGLWRPVGVHPPSEKGTLVMVCFVLSAFALRRAWRTPQSGEDRRLPALAVALALGLLGIVLQCLAYARLGFGPASDGYASVYVGWTTTFTLAALVTMGWLTSLLTGAWRGRSDDPLGDVRLIGPGLEGASFWWSVMAGIGVVSWVMLYLVK